MADYYINGVNFTTDGVYVSKSQGIIGGIKLRQPVRQEWPDYHGEVVDMAAPRYEARDITLECFMKATSKEDFLSGMQTFMARWMTGTMKRLMIVVDAAKPLVYDVYLTMGPDVDKKWNDSTMVGTFSLKLREPEPVKRVYSFVAAAGALSVSVTVASTKAVTIYWGDGSVSYDIVTGSGAQVHAYASAGTYYISIAGVIEDVTGVTTGATLVWSKLL
jgi:hypothetical protein